MGSIEVWWLTRFYSASYPLGFGLADVTAVPHKRSCHSLLPHAARPSCSNRRYFTPDIVFFRELLTGRFFGVEERAHQVDVYVILRRKRSDPHSEGEVHVEGRRREQVSECDSAQPWLCPLCVFQLPAHCVKGSSRNSGLGTDGPSNSTVPATMGAGRNERDFAMAAPFQGANFYVHYT